MVPFTSHVTLGTVYSNSSSFSFGLHDGRIRSATPGCSEDSAGSEHPLILMMILATVASTGKRDKGLAGRESDHAV